jgi:hypothetical protein
MLSHHVVSTRLPGKFQLKSGEDRRMVQTSTR